MKSIPLLLIIAACCALGACSPAGTSSLALNTAYHPKFMPAEGVIKSGETSGHYAGAAYVCGDSDCKTAIRGN